MNVALQVASARRRILLRNYGITPEQYDEMLKAQNGRCAICGATAETGGGRPNALGERRLPVDHDHATGAVRGLLCVNCNAALGSFRDDPALLQNAIRYLAQFGQNGLEGT